MTDPGTVSTTDFAGEAKKLRRHYKFTEDDLTANRSGFLSEKQKQRLAGYDKGGRKVGLVFGAVLLVAALAITPWELSRIRAFSDDQSHAASSAPRLMSGGAALIIGALISVLVVAGIFLIVSQLIKRKPFRLLSMQGRASLEKGTSAKFRHVYYNLRIDGNEFDGDITKPDLIIQGAEYIVYYLDDLKQVMSAELVAAAE